MTYKSPLQKNLSEGLRAAQAQLQALSAGAGLGLQDGVEELGDRGTMFPPPTPFSSPKLPLRNDSPVRNFPYYSYKLVPGRGTPVRASPVMPDWDGCASQTQTQKKLWQGGAMAMLRALSRTARKHRGLVLQAWAYFWFLSQQSARPHTVQAAEVESRH
jgi:hypothetical protein